MAAISDSYEPTGAMISMSASFINLDSNPSINRLCENLSFAFNIYDVFFLLAIASAGIIFQAMVHPWL
jgi:hypothetical protein